MQWHTNNQIRNKTKKKKDQSHSEIDEKQPLEVSKKQPWKGWRGRYTHNPICKLRDNENRDFNFKRHAQLPGSKEAWK